ncbi:methyltransferase domain-containing protein [Cryobacterium sp. TMT1-19]|uniref:class I SAM-dependent methyltransferase n=1 Tax=unclassified Cryobacterium TaxID=2649013 RepID=UPI000CE37F03|nr:MULTISPECIES: methyltransferase [unclassified Cryobacterium]TFD33869.1 methyltransferase domain-containing protein [Cryobacterium sp. TMT1-19]
MPSDHYFTPAPDSTLKLRQVTVRLGGQERELTTANSVFSPEHIDTGTQVLLNNAPTPPPGGDFLDLGCGWGPISLHLALASPRATIWAVDVNERALDLVRLNAEKLGLTNITAVLPDQMPAHVTFRTIWSNPPIRVGKTELHTMLRTWLPRLEPGSDAWLVVQRNLGSDSLQRWLDGDLPAEYSTSRHSISKGFRVLRVKRQD